MATLENRLLEVDQQSKGDLEAVEEQLKVTFDFQFSYLTVCLCRPFGRKPRNRDVR